MECNSALRMFEVLIHAVIEMNLKNIIILSENNPDTNGQMCDPLERDYLSD